MQRSVGISSAVGCLQDGQMMVAVMRRRFYSHPAFLTAVSSSADAIVRRLTAGGHRMKSAAFMIGVLLASVGTAAAQQVPDRYAPLLKTLGKSGDFKDGVLKVNIPRTDLRVAINGRPAPTPFGFGGWVALTPGADGVEVLMGDLVLTEDEVNPVMSALLDNGLEVTALHNHFFWEQPRVFYMHVHGRDTIGELARKLQPALAYIDKAVARATAPSPASPAPTLNTEALATTIGHKGEQ